MLGYGEGVGGVEVGEGFEEEDFFGFGLVCEVVLGVG